MRSFTLSSLAFAAAVLVPAAALAEPAVALTTTGKLVSFDTANPAGAAAPRAIAGLTAGDKLVGIDYRPATGVLYGIGAGRQLYTIDVAAGTATAVGAPFATPTGTDVDIDFNPAIDRIRYTTDTAGNAVLNPANGAVTANANFTYAPNDSACLITCPTPVVPAVAYGNNRAGTATTNFWALDTARATLVEVTLNANSQFSVVNTRGQLRLGNITAKPTNVAGFDISPNSGTAFAALNEANVATTKLYSVALTGATPGALTDLGVIAGGEQVVDVSVVPNVAVKNLWALYNDSAAGTSRIYPLSSAFPLKLGAGVAVTGLAAGETIVSIDERPATGGLYGLSSAQKLYTIDTVTGAATVVGPANGIDQSAGITIDFNPSVDRIRVVTGSGLNYRLHPDTGAVAAQDTNLSYAAGDTNAGAAPQVLAAAYTNPVPAAPATTLYDLDLRRAAGSAATPVTSFLVSQGSVEGAATPVSPNTGSLFTLGNVSVPRVATDLRAAFDIAADGSAFAFLSPEPTVRAGVADPVVARFYQVNLQTGVANYGVTMPAGATATELPAGIAVDLPVPVAPVGDAGVTDAGPTPTDAGPAPTDAGPKADAGPVVLPDSGTSGTDAGAADAGTDVGGGGDDSGCAVAPGAGGLASGGLAAVGLLLAAVRRRKRA